MERVGEAQLTNALKREESALQRRLLPGDGSRLTKLLEGLTRRYPSQDLADAMPEYGADYEALTVKFSIERVERAVAALRIDPAQTFFPRPDEVAAEIERQQLRKVPSHVYARG